MKEPRTIGKKEKINNILWQTMISKKMVLVFLSPAILVYSIFFFFPVLFTIFTSFFEWTGFDDSMKFVGFGNYLEAFRNPVFWLSVKNTSLIIFAGGFFVFLFAFLFSIILHSNIPGASVVRIILFLPNVISVFAVAAMWNYVYNPESGLLHEIFTFLKIDYLSSVLWVEPKNIFSAVLVAMIWTYTGFYMVIILAGINKIPKEFFESAELDGANSWKKFTCITMPLIWELLVVCYSIWIIVSIKSFDFMLGFSYLDIQQELYTMGIYMYVMGFGVRVPIFRMGYASAIGVQMILMAFILVIFVRKILQREKLEY